MTFKTSLSLPFTVSSCQCGGLDKKPLLPRQNEKSSLAHLASSLHLNMSGRSSSSALCSCAQKETTESRTDGAVVVTVTYGFDAVADIHGSSSSANCSDCIVGVVLAAIFLGC